MESFKFLKFWHTAPVRDIDSDIESVKKFADTVGYVGNPAPTESTDEEIDKDDESFFDLVFTTGNTKVNNISVSEKTLKQRNGKLSSPESPRDVFFAPNSFPIDANPKPHSPTSILRSTPKFSVCFLGFRKSKPEKVVIDDSSTVSPKIQNQKCKVEEGADMGKYLKIMKPRYSRASKRFTEKSQLLSSPSVQSLISPRISSEEKQVNRVAVLGAVRKRLGKSRSAASSFAGGPMNRRDDSLLEQNDGIQSAILHCKRSYSSARKGTSNK